MGITALSFSQKEENIMSKSKEDFVPQWAKKVIWYQIFPERFHNGDTSNDPTFKDIEGAYPHDVLLHGKFIHGLQIGMSSNLMKKKTEKIFGLICSEEDTVVTCKV